MSESRRKFQWIETRKRNHALANLHGSARQLAWLDFATCMVPLPALHGWTKNAYYIGVDFALASVSGENSSKNFERCKTTTSHPAIAELCKVRHDNFAPCDSRMSHLATSRYRTLPLSPVAPCDPKSPFFTPKNRPSRTAHHRAEPPPMPLNHPARHSARL